MNGYNIGIEKVKTFLELISIRPDEFKQKLDQASRQLASKNKALLPQRTFLNPLIKNPIIKVGQTYYAPVPQLILERCGTGIYEGFKESLEVDGTQEAAKFSEYYGIIFERYIKLLLEETGLSLKIWFEPIYKYNNNELKTCDVIIQEEETLVLLELKTKPMRLVTKNLMPELKFKMDLKEPAKGIETIVRTAKHLKSKDLVIKDLNIDQIKKWLGIVVTLDEYGIKPIKVQFLNYDVDNITELTTQPIKEYFFNVCQDEIAKSKFINWQDVVDFPLNNLEVVSADIFEGYLGSMIKLNNKFSSITDVNVSASVHPYLVKIMREVGKSIKKS